MKFIELTGSEEAAVVEALRQECERLAHEERDYAAAAWVERLIEHIAESPEEDDPAGPTSGWVLGELSEAIQGAGYQWTPALDEVEGELTLTVPLVDGYLAIATTRKMPWRVTWVGDGKFVILPMPKFRWDDYDSAASAILLLAAALEARAREGVAENDGKPE